MRSAIDKILTDSLELHKNLHSIIPSIEAAAELMIDAVKGGSKIMFAGNGGSAADAQHLAAELVNRFLRERRPLPGLALTTDSSNLTSIANDYSYEEIFSKQIEALGQAGDVFLGISTSGNSGNIVRAVEVCKERGIKVVTLTGAGGQLKDMADCGIAVPSSDTPRIQEVHILIGHMLCGFIEDSIASESN